MVSALRRAKRACELTEREEPEYLHTLAIVHCALADVQAGDRRFAPALENYYQAIEADPEYDAALLNLAILRTSSSDAA